MGFGWVGWMMGGRLNRVVKVHPRPNTGKKNLSCARVEVTDLKVAERNSQTRETLFRLLTILNGKMMPT